MSAFQVHSENQDCGKLVKKTKKKLYWRFKLLGCPPSPYSSTPAVCHELAMIHSFLSGKKNVFLDNRLVHSSATAEPSFHFSCTLGGGRLVSIDFESECVALRKVCVCVCVCGCTVIWLPASRRVGKALTRGRKCTIF